MQAYIPLNIKVCLILQVRFLADLVNCRVIVAGSLLAMFDNFIEVTLEDNIPQVSSHEILPLALLIYTEFMPCEFYTNCEAVDVF